MKYKLKDIAKIKYGKNQKKVVFLNGNIPIYGTGGLMGYAKESLYEKPSVLIGRKGTINKVRYVTHPFWTVDTLFYTIIDEKIIRPHYFYYLMTQINLLQLNEGTTIPSLRTETLNRIELEVPSLEKQDEILSCVEPIEQKIELNQKINNNLEQQAQAIFDNMFPNISNGSYAIGDYITPKRGKSLLSKNAIFGDVPVIAGGLEPSTYHNVANTQSPVLAISASGANAGYVSLWNIPIWSSDSSYIDSSMTDDVYFWYVLLKKRQKEIFDAQTGSAQPHIYPQHIASMSVSNLDIEEVHSYTSIVTPIFKKIGHHKEENTRLASLRDTLLPKLMSGELDVSDIKL
ncbi:restriction endonuclease subunit S [Eubacterium ventriosum]|jgi:restriction endonuclease S subunit|uniref:Restriction endonuclease subunit S n=1 Tax=Eubacterium ventriosum TaxID=39496 RepID=A0A415LF19_9FIRM|nr:restriction endonuclease subunit S [Eubacterium ventriosum]RHL47111.1 restriction endonuclease subunit S [Eubacterium ventriosum]